MHEQLYVLSEAYKTDVSFKAWSQVVAASLRWSDVTAVSVLQAWPGFVRQMNDKVLIDCCRRLRASALPVAKV